MNKKTCCGASEPSKPAATNHLITMLLNFFPLLRNSYRELDEGETESEDVFKELFPDKDLDFGLLKAVYQYQKLKKILKG